MSNNNKKMDKEDMVHTYNGVLLSDKNNEIMSIATKWMDFKMIILSEVSQTEKDKYHMVSLYFYVWHLKI